jgi:putative oxidoreductase
MRTTTHTTHDGRYAFWATGILRIVVALLFMQHGMQKLFAFPAPAQPGGGPVALGSLIGVAGVLEMFGGLLLLVGLFTRPVAFLLSGEMAVAYFMMHAPQGFWPILNRGELAVLNCFVFLYLAAAGAGAFSLDGWRARGRPGAHPGERQQPAVPPSLATPGRSAARATRETDGAPAASERR